jgi:signal transduction histidine kinase
LNIREYLNRIGETAIFITGVFLALLIGFIDLMTGVELSFSIFYLIPISLVAWYSNKYKAIIISVISALAWLIADMHDINRYSNPGFIYWNALVRFGFFVIVVYLIHALKMLNEGLEEIVKERTSDLISEINERKNAEEELQRKGEKLRQLIKRTHNIIEEENSNIARDIHDVLGQSLTAIKIETVSLSKKFSNNAELVDRLFSIVNTIDDTIKSVREISTKLRPRLLDELGLLPAVELLLREFRTRTGIRYNLTCPDENLKLTQEVSIAAFRIFQEALTNIIRHAKATNVRVNIKLDGDYADRLVMEVIDNGVGFLEDLSDRNSSLGILGMKERAQVLGGNVEVVSAEDWGTAVIAKIPLVQKYSQAND